jgi:uncharacterized protein (TIGR02246 family)
MTRIVLRILARLFLPICFVTTGQAQSASPEAVVEDFVKAWNSHDGKAFDRLFTDDAIWVPVAEVIAEGRGNIVKDFTEIHSTWAKNTTITQSALKVRTLRPDVAALLFHLRYLKDGKEVPGIDRAMIMVAVKQPDGWRIAVGQITKEAPPAPKPSPNA